MVLILVFVVVQQSGLHEYLFSLFNLGFNLGFLSFLGFNLGFLGFSCWFSWFSWLILVLILVFLVLILVVQQSGLHELT